LKKQWEHYSDQWSTSAGKIDRRLSFTYEKWLGRLRPGENGWWSTKSRQNFTRAGKKPMADWKNELQIYEAGRK